MEYLQKLKVLRTYLENDLKTVCEKHKLERKEAIESCLSAAREICTRDAQFCNHMHIYVKDGVPLINILGDITLSRATWYNKVQSEIVKEINHVH